VFSASFCSYSSSFKHYFAPVISPADRETIIFPEIMMPVKELGMLTDNGFK